MAVYCREVIELAKALGLPLLAVVVSVATYFSGRWQVRIAREKLRHDLYDRRFDVYMAFHELLVAIVEKDEVETEFRKANAARFQSPFLLDGLQTYLEELSTEAFRINAIGKLIRDPSARAAQEPREFFEAGTKLSQDKVNFANRVLELSQKFEPFLKLTDFSNQKHRRRRNTR
jgi:hypothetical protein